MSELEEKIHKHRSTIGIVSPSFFVEKEGQYLRGLNYLQSLGYKIKLGDLATKKYYNTTGTIAQRAEEINLMFSDSDVDIIISSDGGCRAIDIIEFLDYDLIKQHPKPLCGFSDITHLLLAIYSKTKNCSVYGMDLINGFGEIPSLDKSRNVDCFFTTLNEGVFNYSILKGSRVLRPGSASGIVMGGWLNAIQNLYRTDYFPAIDNIVFFWEAVDEEFNKISMMLKSLRLSGLLDHVSCMVVGTLTNCVEKEYYDCVPDIESIILESCEGYNFPIIVDAAFGHGDKKCSFRYGELIKINTEEL